VNSNYFKLLGIHENFKVSPKSLQKAFTQLQRQLHPDKFSLKDKKEQEISSESSALVNKAYFTLLKPLSRGIYMLQTKGVVLGEEVRADDPEFLMELMELNEEIDDTESTEAKRGLYHDMQLKLDKITDELEISFQNDDVASAKKLVIKLKYYTNISDRIYAELPPE